MRIVLVSLLTVVAAGCGPATGAKGKTTVVASFYPLAFAAEQIGGPKVDVTNLTPPGAEPHDVELTPGDVARIQTADVVLYLSHGFQPAVEEALDGAKGKRIDVLAGLGLHEESGKTDPHVWLDPVLFARIVRRVGAALGNRGARERARRAGPLPRPRLPDGPCPLRPPRLRHEPRRVRLSRGPLSPPPDRDHRDRSGVGAEPEASRLADRPRPPRARDDGLLRAPRLAAPRPDRRA